MQRSRDLQLIFGIVLALVLPSHAELPQTLVEAKRPSPDGRWAITWHCEDRWESDACSIALSRRSDGKVFFRHSTFPRYIKAVWNRNSTKCLLLDAPDNANTLLWLFRVRNRKATTEKLDYEAIGREIERARPETGILEPGSLLRSGVEKITWTSNSELHLKITYNNICVTLRIDTSKPNSAGIQFVSYRGRFPDCK